MTRQIVLRGPPSSVHRRQPLLDRDREYSSRGGTVRTKVRMAEVVGGTTAECAVVCCCCPCTLVNLLVLVVYKVPAGLCRKALRRKRRCMLMKKGMLQPHERKCSCIETEFQIQPITGPVAMVNALEAVGLDDKEVLELEKEMWDKFYGTGFWRSPSQRSEISS